MRKLFSGALALVLGFALGAAMPTGAQIGYQTTSTLSGLLTTDGTNVTLASGQLLLPDGTKTAPPLAQASNTDLGVYFGTNTISISINDSEEARFSNDQIRMIGSGTAANALVAIGGTAQGLYEIATGNVGMSVGGALVMDWEDTNAAGAGADLVTISSTLGIMDNSDTFRGLFVDLTSADHTGTGNTIYGIDVDSIVSDAQATEYGIAVQSGWEYGMRIEGVNAEIQFNDSSAHVRFSGGLLTFADNVDGSDLDVLTLNNFPDANADFADTFLVSVGDNAAIAAMDGSDTYSMLKVDFTNADHTGTTNILRGISIDAITGDANADYSAIYVGALTGTTGSAGELEYAVEIGGGYDAAFRDVGVAFANLQAADNGSFVYCTDCDPSTSPCASAAGQTGAWAFRQNGAWECPIP